jgi:hypothetical protein
MAMLFKEKRESFKKREENEWRVYRVCVTILLHYSIDYQVTILYPSNKLKFINIKYIPSKIE